MPITSYEEFQAFDISIETATQLCSLDGLGRPLFLRHPDFRSVFWEGYGKSMGADEDKMLKLHMLNRALQMFVSFRGALKSYNETDIENLARSI